MIKLSVVIIAFNEERDIARCLSSIHELADEIVVVDSYSTDKTEEICNKYKTRFIKHKFDGHIEQKNWAITQASYPHILSLDADEALSEELKSSILKIKKKWEYDGYCFNRLNNYCGKWIKYTSMYPDRKLRLWDSRKGKWGGTNPHDKFIMDKNSRIKLIKGNLLHYVFYTFEEHARKIDQFSTIAAKELFNKGYKAGRVKIFTHTFWRFFREYFIYLGFLIGKDGYRISRMSARYSYLKYVKLGQLYKQNEKI